MSVMEARGADQYKKWIFWSSVNGMISDAKKEVEDALNAEYSDLTQY
jgi:hypothetical protein